MFNRAKWIVPIIVASFCLPLTSFGVTDEEVGKTIKAMKQWLYSKQGADGSWEKFKNDRDADGYTAMATLALLVSGESMQHPKMKKALEYLRSVEMEGTYSVAVRAHIWSYLPDSYLPMLKKDQEWLLMAHRNHAKGLFNYTQGDYEKKQSRYDHSVTQYGMLGLWQAAKRNLHVEQSFWKTIERHFKEAHFESGGWGYNDNQASERESMTLAGLTALLVAQQELYRQSKTADKEITEHIGKGLMWMDKRFNGGTTWYALYGLERVALASGSRYFNKLDWFDAGASKIVRLGGNGELSGGHGGNISATAFGLMFLSRGRVPVWANKIAVQSQKWNNHPNDLYFLSEFLSNQREGEVNWQVVSADSSPDEWLLAPVAFISSDYDLELTDAQKANLRQFLDRGGLLVCNPDDGNPSFKESVRQLVKEMYPQYPMRNLEPSHPLYYVHHQIKNPGQYKVQGVSNGARELVLMFESDIGYQWQSQRNQAGGPWELGANLFALATNKGVLANRLVPPFESPKKRASSGEVTVGRAKYDGNWLPEPACWAIQGISLHNKAGISVKTSDVELSAIGESDLKFIHLAGTDKHKLTNEERQAISDFVTKQNGTLFIETVGGQGDFSEDIEKQLAGVFQNPAVPLTTGDKIISGQGLAGGEDCSRVVWRWRTVQLFRVGNRPRLAAILVDGRPAVIISREDLSLGMMGVRHWHINGYSPKSARKIAANMLLSVK